jgi:dUTP pyrophosphatase
MLEIKVARTHVDAKVPTKRSEDAGYDIYPLFEEDYRKIYPNETTKFNTGIRMKIPEGYYMQLAERGSTGSFGIGQRAGVIDSGYTGEIIVAVTNHNPFPILIYKDIKKVPARARVDTNCYPYEKAICQGILLPVPLSHTVEISQTEMDAIKTQRGSGAFGSSGK